MSSQLPNGKQQFIDGSGLPLNGGNVYHYIPGTSTPKTTYQDKALTIANANPIPLDARGQAVIWGSGDYRQVLQDSLGNLIWDQVISDTSSTGLAVNLAAPSGSSLVGFLQAGTGAVARTVQSKLRDIVNVQDFGTDFGGSLAAAITAFPLVEISPGSPVNTTTPVTIPLTKGIIRNSALITNSGSGTLVNSGVDIGYLNNPSGLSNWTTTAAQNYEGLSVDLGSYGVRQFGTHPNIIGITGSVNIPATAANSGNGIGIAGYVKNAAPTGGAGTNGVAVYGEANCEATNSLVWGFNSRSIDNGFATTVWGGEFDINVTNVNSVPIGVNVVGGSTVEPSNSIGFWCGALGAFSSPPKKWQRAFLSDDGCAFTALEIGTAALTASTGMQPINGFYRNGSNVRTRCLTISGDGSGNIIFDTPTAGLLVFQSNGSQVLKLNGAAIGFYNQAPVGKQVISGSKGGNAALASLMTALSAIGLFTDSTT
jgi:hypothetical protein